MSYATTVLADTPFSYWRLGDALTSGNAADSSGNSHLLAYSGVAPSCTPGQAGALLGDADTAVLLNGTNGYLQRAGGPDGCVGTGSGSMEVWCKTSSVPSRRSLLCCGYGSASGIQGFNLDVSATQVIAEFRTATPTEAAATVAIADGLWHHLLMTLTRGTPDVVRLYVDGVQVASANCATAGQSYQPHTSFAFFVGCDTAQSVLFGGTVDEVALYNTALSAARVLAHYQAAVPALAGSTALLFL